MRFQHLVRPLLWSFLAYGLVRANGFALGADQEGSACAAGVSASAAREARAQEYANGESVLGQDGAAPIGAKGQDSFEQLQELAEQGDLRAQNKLGRAYATGVGVQRNDGEALRWVRAAAEHGLAVAQYNLVCFMSRDGARRRTKQPRCNGTSALRNRDWRLHKTGWACCIRPATESEKIQRKL